MLSPVGRPFKTLRLLLKHLLNQFFSASRTNQSTFNTFYIPPSRIFHPNDVAKLEALGLLTPVDENGFRKLHRRRISAWAAVDHFEFPLDAHPDTHPEAFAPCPDQIISKATMIICGFTEEKAEEIWYQWENWPVIDWAYKMEQTLLDYLLEVVQYPKSVHGEEDDNVWTEAMDGWGISAELQDAIMDPEYRAQRNDFTCDGVVKDTIVNRYEALYSIRRASRDRAVGNQPSFPTHVFVDDKILPVTEWMERQGISLEDL